MKCCLCEQKVYSDGELSALENLLKQIPEDRVIERIGLESRKAAIIESLSKAKFDLICSACKESVEKYRDAYFSQQIRSGNFYDEVPIETKVTYTMPNGDDIEPAGGSYIRYHNPDLGKTGYHIVKYSNFEKASELFFKLSKREPVQIVDDETGGEIMFLGDRSNPLWRES